VRGHALQHRGRGGVVRDGIRHAHDRRRRCDDDLRIRARRRRPRDAVADREVGHACADALDAARALEARDEGQRAGIEPRAKVDVDEVHARSCNADAELSGARRARVALGEREHFGSTDSFDQDRVRHARSLAAPHPSESYTASTSAAARGSPVMPICIWFIT
jgi:hypothetical protein